MSNARADLSFGMKEKEEKTDSLFLLTPDS